MILKNKWMSSERDWDSSPQNLLSHCTTTLHFPYKTTSNKIAANISSYIPQASWNTNVLQTIVFSHAWAWCILYCLCSFILIVPFTLCLSFKMESPHLSEPQLHGDLLNILFQMPTHQCYHICSEENITSSVSFLCLISNTNLHYIAY
jgi:hypothetical protein